jgi:hypothetical protein
MSKKRKAVAPAGRRMSDREIRKLGDELALAATVFDRLQEAMGAAAARMAKIVQRLQGQRGK